MLVLPRFVRPSRQAKPLFRHPSQVIVTGFAVAVAIGTVLLMLPFARTGEGGAPFLTALFTATSAVCVTGLITVDTATYWTVEGQVVILALIQVGGFGIMTMASLLGVLVSRRLGLRSRLTAAAETRSIGIGDVRTVLFGVLRVTALFEAVIAVMLSVRMILGYGAPVGRGIWLGVFHAVSAFNNAGFDLYGNSLVRFVADPWIILPIAAAVIVGGIGFPVLLELRRHFFRPGAWSMHSKMTLITTAVLLVLGGVFFTVNEWSSPATLGPLSWRGKMLAGFFQSVMTRTAGFNSIDVAGMSEASLLGSCVLMFIGGGSAGTAGGIKVTTFVVLLFALIAEVRGEHSVHAFDRRVSDRVIRQGLTVALLSIAAVMASTLVLLELTGFRLATILFEVVSAFATVGQSTGVTAAIPAPGRLILVLLMFVGRLGPIALVSALALRHRDRLYELPEGRPIIG